PGSPGCTADRPHRTADRPLQDPQEGSPQPPWSAADGQPPPQPARLPEEEGRRALQGPDREAWPASLSNESPAAQRCAAVLFCSTAIPFSDRNDRSSVGGKGRPRSIRRQHPQGHPPWQKSPKPSSTASTPSRLRPAKSPARPVAPSSSSSTTPCCWSPPLPPRARVRARTSSP